MDAFFEARLEDYDAHETEALLAAGVSRVTVLRSWGATYVQKAEK